MRDIALLGYSRSGKDTAGAHLVDTFGYVRVSFADPVRDALLALDPIVSAYTDQFGDDHRDVSAETVRLSEVVRSLGWERAKDAYPEVRDLLQRLGTDVVRKRVHDRAWIWQAGRGIGAAWNARKHVVVTDVRFPNEADHLRDNGFRLVWVDRPGHGPTNEHESEVALGPRDADVTLTNAGSVDDLRARIVELAR